MRHGTVSPSSTAAHVTECRDMLAELREIGTELDALARITERLGVQVPLLIEARAQQQRLVQVMLVRLWLAATPATRH